MNIGIVTTWFERGAAIVSRAYMETLALRHNVFIYARGGEEYAIGDPDWDKENVTWGKRVPWGITTIDWADFRKWVRRCRLDMVIFNEQHDWDIILKCLDLNLVLGAYVDYYTEETVPFFNLYDFLLCNTKRHYSVFKTHPQAIYIPWGTDCNLFKPLKSPSKTDTIRFFHSAGMGGVRLRKGTDILVRAFQKVSGNAQLIIHSQIGVEKYGDVSHLITNDSRITFIERTVKAPGLYHLGDVYVYPTRLEGIGLTIAEALASGLPVITTDNAPMNEFVENDYNGKLVRVERYRKREDGYFWPESICSESALAEAMQFYVDNPTQLQQHKQNARAYAELYLDWRKNSVVLLEQVARFSRISKPQNLVQSVSEYENARYPDRPIALAFAYHNLGEKSNVIKHLVEGIRKDPRWLYNGGVLSIGLNALLGNRVATLFRQGLKRLCPALASLFPPTTAARSSSKQ